MDIHTLKKISHCSQKFGKCSEQWVSKEARLQATNSLLILFTVGILYQFLLQNLSGQQT
tara:strand:- start:456 stop:632 length:177 start_codon:yes stop_codon:yes gene_type:complete